MTTKNARTAAMQADNVTEYAVPGSSDYLLKAGDTMSGTLTFSSGDINLGSGTLYANAVSVTSATASTITASSLATFSGGSVFNKATETSVAQYAAEFKTSSGTTNAGRVLFGQGATYGLAVALNSTGSTSATCHLQWIQRSDGALQSTPLKLSYNGDAQFGNNVGVGVTPSNWGTGGIQLYGLDISTVGSLIGSTSWGALGGNLYYNGTNWKFKTSGYASLITTSPGSMAFYTSTTSGAADDNISLVNHLTIDYTGDIVARTGRIGYGSGTGGTVTQTTSKSTAVTLDKPSGHITMHAASLAAGSTVLFTFNNSYISSAGDILLVSLNASGIANTGYYNVWCSNGAGAAVIALKNVHSSALAEAVTIRFMVVKGSIA